MKLYDRIKSRREELNMSQEELAAKMGYKSRSSINKIELGKSDIPQSKIASFAKALQTTPAYLMGWTSDDQNTKKEIETKCDLSSINEYKNVFKQFSFSIYRCGGYQPVYRVLDEKNGTIFEKVTEPVLYDLLTFINNNANFIRNEIYRRIETNIKDSKDEPYLAAAHNDAPMTEEEEGLMRQDLDEL
ncbi:transcriptional regulator with XRE-family HTH domain [Ruminiclostridium sufflavum DSM 19573]|uniref:Transcriptional regulator with XRE-family HTH domain n=1 Tax=Ruminiclostridium sufflavum DSM 19573 TaxID=1121337 RepID=A0A318XRG3_9FIRM|nr:helix-turn-helix transcriptional regulator [Ruminiclostridium sufflavum]PYG90167.1 transcriptional regulator with XRE-family HTH domain [Ruminiclostridium sufflavum DSM 19573]